jgi:probable phosphoglycerate mutase
MEMTQPSRGSQSLRRLVLVRAAATEEHAAGRLVGRSDPSLSPEGRAEARERRRHWEWIDAVVASPMRRGRETAKLLAGGTPLVLSPDLRPRNYGHWEGLTPAEIEARAPIAYADWQAGRPCTIPRGEGTSHFEDRVARALEGLLGGPWISPLVVTHGDVIREIAQRLLGAPLPDGRPLPGEIALLTRVHGGKFRLGRPTSDPPPLRSALALEGLSGVGAGPIERHVAHLERRR